MQQEKFASAAALIEENDMDEPSKPVRVKKPWEGDSPAGIKKGSKEYWRRECLSGYDKAAQAHLQTPITPGEFDAILDRDKDVIHVSVRRTSSKRQFQSLSL